MCGEAVWLGSGSVTRSQAGCGLGLQASEGLAKRLFPTWPTRVAGKLVLAVEGGLLLLPAWPPPWGCLSVLTAEQLLSSLRVNDPRESKVKIAVPLMTQPWESYTVTSTIACWSPGQPSCCEKDRAGHEPESRISSGARREAGPHNLNTQ